jgi:hypothetical protein
MPSIYRPPSELGTFHYSPYADLLGESHSQCRAKREVGWLRMITDVPIVVLYVSTGELNLRVRGQPLKRYTSEPVFCPTH